MPWSNAIGATPAALTTIALYLGDATHAHHEEYDLTPIQVLGAKSVQEFLAFAEKASLKNSKKGSGRPPVNAASWFVIRTPDGTRLSGDERSAYEEAARDEAGCGGPVVGIMNWHRNELTGSEELNLLAAAFTATGHLVRDRTSDPIKSLRQRMDEVTRGLNLLRRAKGIKPIQTMQEAQKSNRDARKTEDLAELLARVPKPPVTANGLKLAILTIDGKVTRFNDAMDTISVKMPKKPTKRLGISKLLADIKVAVAQQREAQRPALGIPMAPEIAEAPEAKPTPPKILTERITPHEPEMLPP